MKKNNRLQRTEAGILYLRDVRIYRNMNLERRFLATLIPMECSG